VLAVTSIKHPTCLKQSYNMLPNFHCVLIFTSIKQPPALGCHFCASFWWLLDTGLTGLGHSFHAFVSGLQYLTQFHVSVSVKPIYSTRQLGLGRYVQQPIRYVFDTDLADTIRIRYNTHVHEGYKIKQFEFKQQSEYFRFK